MRAMQAAIDLADGLDEHTILAMHAALMSHLYPEIAGKWRDEQVDRRGRLRTRRCRIRATAPRSRAVPVSAGLLADTERYFDVLTVYREGEPAAIVEIVANASFRAIANGCRLAQDIAQTRAAWDDKLTARRDAAAWRLPIGSFAGR